MQNSNALNVTKYSRTLLTLLTTSFLVATLYGCSSSDTGNRTPPPRRPVPNNRLEECKKSCDLKTKDCTLQGDCVASPVKMCQKTCTDPQKGCDNQGNCVDRSTLPKTGKNCDVPCDAINQSYCDHTTGTCKQNTKQCDPSKDAPHLVCFNGEWVNAFNSDTCAQPCPQGTKCQLGACIDETDFGQCSDGTRCSGKFGECNDAGNCVPKESCTASNYFCGPGKKCLRKDPSSTDWECKKTPSTQPTPTCPTCQPGEVCSASTGYTCMEANTCNSQPCQDDHVCWTTNQQDRNCYHLAEGDCGASKVIYDIQKTEIPIDGQFHTFRGSFKNASQQWTDNITIANHTIQSSSSQPTTDIPIRLYIPQSKSDLILSYHQVKGPSVKTFDFIRAVNDACKDPKHIKEEYGKNSVKGASVVFNRDSGQIPIKASETNLPIILFYSTNEANPGEWELQFKLAETDPDQCQKSACSSTSGTIDQCIHPEDLFWNDPKIARPPNNQKVAIQCATINGSQTQACTAESGSTPAQCAGASCSNPIVLDATSQTTFKAIVFPNAYNKEQTTIERFKSNTSCPQDPEIQIDPKIQTSVTFKVTGLKKGNKVRIEAHPEKTHGRELIDNFWDTNLINDGTTKEAWQNSEHILRDTRTRIFFHSSCNLDSCVKSASLKESEVFLYLTCSSEAAREPGLAEGCSKKFEYTVTQDGDLYFTLQGEKMTMYNTSFIPMQIVVTK